MQLPYVSVIEASTEMNCGFHFTIGAIPFDALELANYLNLKNPVDFIN